MELRIKLTEQELYSFMKRGFYRGAGGIVSFVCVMFLLVIVALSWTSQTPAGRIVLLIGVVLVMMMQPFMLRRKAAAQLRDPEQSKEIAMRVDYNGIRAQQGSTKANIGWRQVEKVTRIGEMYVITLHSGRSYLIPDRVLTGTKKEQFAKILKTYVPSEKMKGIGS